MKKTRYAFVVLAVLALGVGAGNFLWTSKSVNDEQGKWCSLIVTLDQANAAAPKRPAPGTFTLALVDEIHQLRKSLGCGQ